MGIVVNASIIFYFSNQNIQTKDLAITNRKLIAGLFKLCQVMNKNLINTKIRKVTF